MQVIHLGTQILDFIPKGGSESDRVQGCKVFYSYSDSSDHTWVGNVIKHIFIRSDSPLYKKVFEVLKPGIKFSPVYEFNGKYPRLVDITV